MLTKTTNPSQTTWMHVHQKLELIWISFTHVHLLIMEKAWWWLQSQEQTPSDGTPDQEAQPFICDESNRLFGLQRLGLTDFFFSRNGNCVSGYSPCNNLSGTYFNCYFLFISLETIFTILFCLCESLGKQFRDAVCKAYTGPKPPGCSAPQNDFEIKYLRDFS